MKIGDKQFFNLSKIRLTGANLFPSTICILVFIEDILYCVQYFSERRARLIIFQPFLHFFCRKICTVAYTSFSHIKIHSTVAQIQWIDLYFYLVSWLHIWDCWNWPKYFGLSILASYWTWPKCFGLWPKCFGFNIVFFVPIVGLVFFHFLYCYTLKVYCTCLLWKNCNNPRLVKDYLVGEYMILYEYL